MAFDPARLAREGWVRRNVASEPRLAEAVAMYEELGFEVIVLPATEASEGGCTVCIEGEGEGGHRVIYTRPAPPENP